MEGWQHVKLSDISEFQRGLTYAKSDEVDASSNAVLRANNVDLRTNLLDLSELRYISDAVEVPTSKKVRKGALLVCTASGSKSHLGKVAYIDDNYDYAFGGFMGMLVPAPLVDGRYLFHVMTSDLYKRFIGEISDGANINNLKFGDLGRFEFPLPPLSEQKRIVAILDEAFDGLDKAIANTEKNLTNIAQFYEQHVDAIIEGLAITLPLTSLSEVCEVKDGTHDSPRYVDDGIPFVTQKNIREDGLSFEKVRFISHDDHSKFYKRSNVARGDILISMIGANRGMACIVDDARVFSIKNVGLIKKSDNVDQGYLLAYLKSTRATAYVAEASRGGAQEFIGLTALRKFPIVLPPLVEQTILSKRFHELRDQIGNVTEAYDQKLSSLRELKSALLAKAFSGRLASKCSLSEAAE